LISRNPVSRISCSNRRSIRLDGQPNFRDLGGYKAVDGRTVKWRTVFRSGELTNLTDHDLEVLEKLGIRTVIDFRTEPELQSRGGVRLPKGARAVALPIEQGDVGSLVRGELSTIPEDLLIQVNRLFVRDHTKEYAALLQEVADPNKRPLVLQCSQGKDRAGMGAAVILLALRVPWETIREDYLLTNIYCRGTNETMIAYGRELIAQRKSLPPDQVDMSRVRSIMYADPEYIDAAHQEIMGIYGSMDAYLSRGLGATDEELKELRDQLLEEPLA
jgi:protein-tyrosine phosphatase